MFESGDYVGDPLPVLQSLAHELSAIFNQFTVFGGEGRQEMTVNVEFAGHLAAHKDWNHDLRLGFDRAGKIAWVLPYVIHNHRLPRRCRRPADALVQMNAGV